MSSPEDLIIDVDLDGNIAVRPKDADGELSANKRSFVVVIAGGLDYLRAHELLILERMKMRELISIDHFPSLDMTETLTGSSELLERVQDLVEIVKPNIPPMHEHLLKEVLREKIDDAPSWVRRAGHFAPRGRRRKHK